MKKKLTIITLILSILSCNMDGPGLPPDFPGGAQPLPPQNSDDGDFIENEILLKVSASTPVDEIDNLIPGTRVKILPFPGDVYYVLYRLGENADPEVVLASLASTAKVLHGERNALYTMDLYTPDDTYYEQYQYAPKITDADLAWDIETGSGDITVAVIDSGINGEHEDLEGRVIAGWNILEGKPIPASANTDTVGHGSHVAGIIGAAGDNGKGIAGVAWNVKLMPVKIFGDTASTGTMYIAEAVIWAVDHGARIINMSLGGPLFSMALMDAVNYAYEKGIVVVVSMGNDGKAMIKYPAALPGVIAVGASNGRDEISYFSTRGGHISVCAPGESIYSLKIPSNTGYTYSSGTSMSAPFVSGLAALLLSHNLDLTPGEVRSMIEDGADPLGEETFSPDYGYGRVNVYNTLTMVPRDNYQSFTVNVTNRGEPVGGAVVQIEDTATSTIVQSGITSYGGNAGGVTGRVAFNHIRRGDYKIHVHVGAHQVQEISLSQGETPIQVSFAFDTPMVLIVNAIKDSDISVLTDEHLYTQGLNAMDKYFSTWRTYFHGPPTSEVLNLYDIVIWFTGKIKTTQNNYLEVLTAHEIGVIKNYLDSGGSLYLCGNNIAEHLVTADPAFLADYLHAEYIAPSLPYDELSGAGLLDGMELILYLEDDDEIAPLSGAEGILLGRDINMDAHWGGVSWRNGYKLIFTTLCPNEILYSDPDTFFEDIITWLEN